MICVGIKWLLTPKITKKSSIFNAPMVLNGTLRYLTQRFYSKRPTQKLYFVLNGTATKIKCVYISNYRHESIMFHIKRDSTMDIFSSQTWI